jgi:mycothione reductase
MGTSVTILGRGSRLVRGEEPEISTLLEKGLKKRMSVHTGMTVISVKKSGKHTVVAAKDKKSGREKKFSAEYIMMATGRVSNADLLRPERSGIAIDERGYIKVNNYLQTSMENIWAVGDAIGRQMFTHAGDSEARIAWHNATHEEKIKMDFDVVPHAVFTHPQIASVGLSEAEANRNYDILVGRARYSDFVAGDTMAEKEGFAKAIVEKGTRRLLGFHIIGPHAPLIIQEAANAVADKANIESITKKMHTFPTLPELIPEALENLTNAAPT